MQNDFQRLLGDISQLRCTIGIKPDELIRLNKTLDGDKDLNSLRELSDETEKELTLIEGNLQKAHVDHVDPNLNYLQEVTQKVLKGIKSGRCVPSCKIWKTKICTPHH